MNKYTVRGPGRECIEINASSLDEALAQAKSRYPGKHVEADAAEVIYVCSPGENPDACQTRLQ
ncbi:hypothetical protein [Desulfoscipio geothermicus]|uniref:Uncharacterized protein n=1 Tax=Desulfoscipio geothermicus DSM 3669 TaxID=1121426 RepID=A0A1I6EDG4_9FIRM|nr:hypothetical protein [Desulfoscipio geothermicus]SFR15773.1 hypothetical protein SAMN05660706_1372 [Desulfoscipio geothermicus DSM 3669]